MLMRTVVLAGVAALVIACTVVPVYNVKSAPVTTASGKTPEAAQVRRAIVTAGASLGWKMTDLKPGVMQGTLDLRSHQAVVEIPYSEKSYSIVKTSTTNLNESGDTIHKNYNGWIQNLERAINAGISTLD